MTDEQYFNIDLLSYSKLSEFDENGAKSINKEYGGDTNAYNLGALVEEIIQGDSKSVKEKFIITDNVKPTAMLGVLTDAMIDNEVEHTLKKAVTLAKMLGLWSFIKKEEVYNKKIDIPQFWEYLKLQNTNKRIVSPETYILAKAMANGLLTSKYTKDIFTYTEDQEVLYQEVIIWNKKTCKSKLDIIKVDHKEKTITPYDLKTTGFDKEEFINSFYKFRYYIQSSMYSDAIEEWKFKYYSDYLMKPFQFIVVQDIDYSNPLIYTVSDTIINKGREGFYNEEGKLLKKGYLDLIIEYNWHINNKRFNFSKSTYESKGNILIE